MRPTTALAIGAVLTAGALVVVARVRAARTGATPVPATQAHPAPAAAPAARNVNHPETPMSSNRPRRRVSAVVKIVLAGGALLGLGAAATSAAWTDQANFVGTAASSTVGLQGSLDGTTWYDANTTSTSTAVAADLAISIPAATFTGLVPNPNNTSQVTRSVTLYLKSTGSAPLAVTTACTPGGDLFSGTAPLIVTFDSAATTATSCTKTFTFAGGSTTAQSTVLKVTIPAAWPQSYAGKTGSLVVTFTGTAQTS